MVLFHFLLLRLQTLACRGERSVLYAAADFCVCGTGTE